VPEEIDVDIEGVLVDVEVELVVLEEEVEVICEELEDVKELEREDEELELTRSEELTLEEVMVVNEELTVEAFDPRYTKAPAAAATTIIMTITATTTVAMPRFSLKSKIYVFTWYRDYNRCSVFR
jgi:hypothetical protein